MLPTGGAHGFSSVNRPLSEPMSGSVAGGPGGRHDHDEPASATGLQLIKFPLGTTSSLPLAVFVDQYLGASCRGEMRLLTAHLPVFSAGESSTLPMLRVLSNQISCIRRYTTREGQKQVERGSHPSCAD